jgi:hypothetical protein
VLQQWSFPFIQCFEIVIDCSYNGRVNCDRFVDDSGWTWQFGRFEASSCGCYGKGDDAGDQGEIRKRREAVKLESVIPESSFDVVVEPVANNAALIENSVVWRHT